MVFGVLNGVLVGILGLKCGQVMFERGGSRQSLLLPFEGGGHEHLERQQCWGSMRLVRFGEGQSVEVIRVGWGS